MRKRFGGVHTCTPYSGLFVVSLDEESLFSGQDIRLGRESITGTEQRTHSPQMPSEAVLEGWKENRDSSQLLFL